MHLTLAGGLMTRYLRSAVAHIHPKALGGFRSIGWRAGAALCLALSLGGVASVLQASTVPAGAAPAPISPPFTECPQVGSSPSCSILILVTDSGEQVLQDASVGAYDQNIGAEDTLVGVLNESSQPISGVQLSSADKPIFGFDGDGICTFAAGGTNASQPGGFPAGGYCSASQLNGSDPQDYQGPNNTFSNISADTMSGNVNFNTALATGGSTYFSLEEPLTACNFAPGCGYREVAADGGLFSFNAPFFGSMGGKPLNAPIVGMTTDQFTGGYWEVASDGGLFAFNAPFFGSMGGKPLNKPIVGMLSTPDGGGYWEVASDGGLFAFGDAGFYGSMGGQPLNQPIVGMAGTSDGKGYFEVATDGGLFAFGDAFFKGSMGGQPLNSPIVGMAEDPHSDDYWLVAADGGLFAFGGAQFLGSMGGQPLNQPIVGMAATPDGNGYFEVARDGGLFAFGDAVFEGSMGGQPLNAPIVGMSTSAA